MPRNRAAARPRAWTLAGPRIRAGLVSDTHGLLRPAALRALDGCEVILHAGDIGDPQILTELSRLAPVVAVRGNNDTAPWARRLREAEELKLAAVAVYLIHDRACAPLDLAQRGIRVVVSGHSHRPRIEERDGVLFVNPGSAGPRRFRLPVAVGQLLVEGSAAAARIVEIDTSL